VDARGAAANGDGDEGHRRRRAELASRLAHEVRTPVATIKGLAATVLAHDERLGADERRELVGLIGTEAARLLELVEQVALALRIDADGLAIRARPTRLEPLLRDAVAGAGVVDHPVVLDAPSDLEAPVDPRWLSEALRQGITNAARFSPAGQPIEVRARAAGGDALVEIVDRGPGIPRERREEVFERLTTWRPAGYEDRPGAGLGLFICRAIVAAHGGTASVHEGAEGGTILRLRLPMEG
jgi:two-component system sensor histidine kinase KdpD